ncbi:MAG: hypothetical protein K0S78_3690 [Thermomicrobiales bacterium]|jgi:hypothetical protein|nr:hypothetical protein [Thermomicrobiales bacterium]
MSATGNRYSIDSSSLIHCRRVYPIDVFPRLWHLLDGLITANRLVAHEEVWQEIHVGTDPLTTWAAQWRTALCVPADTSQIGVVQQIAANFPLANYLSGTEHRADPWVVALAGTRGFCVISEERGSSQHVPRVPQICNAFGIPHLHILDVMRAEGWTF